MKSEVTEVQELDSNASFEVTGGDWYGADSGVAAALAAAAGLASVPALLCIAATAAVGLI